MRFHTGWALSGRGLCIVVRLRKQKGPLRGGPSKIKIGGFVLGGGAIGSFIYARTLIQINGAQAIGG